MNPGAKASVVGLALLVLGWLNPPPAMGQGGFVLRYSPRPGALARTVLSLRGTVVLKEKSSEVASSDSIVGEMTGIGGVTQRVLSAGGGGAVLEFTLDSLRTRARLLGQSWSERAAADTLRRPFRMEADSRRRFSNPAPQPELAELLEWLSIEFPEEAVAPGGTWTYRVRYTVPPELGELFELRLRGSLEGSITIALDSTVSRLTDTLFYFTLQRHLAPLTVPAVDAGDSAEVALAGASAGTLIWSTGWQSFVSGSEQLRIRGNLRGMGREGLREAELTWVIQRRFQLRP